VGRRRSSPSLLSPRRQEGHQLQGLDRPSNEHIEKEKKKKGVSLFSYAKIENEIYQKRKANIKSYSEIKQE